VIHSDEPFTDHRVDLLAGGYHPERSLPHGERNDPPREVRGRTEEVKDVADLKKGARITGTQRDKLATDLKKKYEKGASIRALAEQTGRSYGFVHRVLSETGVTLRGRGGATRTKKK
jgi:hypothetical protein